MESEGQELEVWRHQATPPPEDAPDVVIVEGKAANAATIHDIRAHVGRTAFVCVRDDAAAADPATRLELCAAGANMVCGSSSGDQAWTRVRALLVNQKRSRGPHTCPFCGLEGLSADALIAHAPLYHIAEQRAPAVSDTCPLCAQVPRRNMQEHIHRHSAREKQPRAAPTIHAFALVLVRHPTDAQRFLVVQEYASKGYWLPGGAVDPGESLQEAAVRETAEEAGVAVALTGVLSVGYAPKADGRVRLRVVFMGQLAAQQQATPKQWPDFESQGAVWATVDEMEAVTLRGPEPLQWARHVLDGGHVAPLSLLSSRA